MRAAEADGTALTILPLPSGDSLKPLDPALQPRSPADLVRGWPEGAALAGLWSSSGATQGAGDRGRWSAFGVPTPNRTVRSLDELREAMRSYAAPNPIDAQVFTSGWIGTLGYELGELLEPAAVRGPAHCRRPPSPEDAHVEFQFVPAALVYDHRERRWMIGGEDAVARSQLLAIASHVAGKPPVSRGYRLGPMRSAMGEAAFVAAAHRAIEYIRAGDIFQVNLAHTLSGAFSGSPRALWIDLCERAAPYYGAYMELSTPGFTRVIAGASPELFLSFDPLTRRIETRPMKGTRVGAGGEESLRTSIKDQAELNMIVDLMRNDVGRVSELASVRVDAARTIERHGGTTGEADALYQATATVSARLGQGFDLVDLLRATFPGGSITGAPKIRAMQIIRELEPDQRGAYCGAMGYVSMSGSAAFNVAIRTAIIGDAGRTCDGAPAGEVTNIAGGVLHYPVGAGIVADSEPNAEWRETLDKARSILSLVNAKD